MNTTRSRVTKRPETRTFQWSPYQPPSGPQRSARPRYDFSTEPEYRQTRWEIDQLIRVRRDGRFSYRGRADRWGPEGGWYGDHWKVRVSGRFVTRDRVVFTRRAPDCGNSNTVSARRDR